MPEAIRSDNGPPFACSQAVLGLSRLSAWWLALGIELERSRPGCPQDNGAHERMHKDVKREIQALASQNVPASDAARQAAFDLWRREFNEQRPHEALGMKCPAEVYVKSARGFKGTPEIITCPGMEVRRVHKCGWIHYESVRYQLTSTLGGWDVGLKAVDGRLEVYFGKLLIGWITPESEGFEANAMAPAAASGVVENPAPASGQAPAPGGGAEWAGGGPLRSASPHCGGHPPPIQFEAASSPPPPLSPPVANSASHT